MLKKIRRKIFKRTMENYEINLEELYLKQNQGAIVIDVRSLQEYNEGHLPGAINIPYYELKGKVCNIINSKKNEIVVYCQEGARGKDAYKTLKKLQFEKVYNLYRGLDNWI